MHGDKHGCERISYHLDCVCGIHIEMPLGSRPRESFQCPSCGVTYGPEQLFEVIQSSPEHELRLKLLKQAAATPRRRRVPLGRGRRQLVVAQSDDEATAWALSFLVGVLVPIAAAIAIWQLGSWGA